MLHLNVNFTDKHVHRHVNTLKMPGLIFRHLINVSIESKISDKKQLTLFGNLSGMSVFG